MVLPPEIHFSSNSPQILLGRDLMGDKDIDFTFNFYKNTLHLFNQVAFVNNMKTPRSKLDEQLQNIETDFDRDQR